MTTEWTFCVEEFERDGSKATASQLKQRYNGRAYAVYSWWMPNSTKTRERKPKYIITGSNISPYFKSKAIREMEEALRLNRSKPEYSAQSERTRTRITIQDILQ
jgi:hypothetical protein